MSNLTELMKRSIQAGEYKKSNALKNTKVSTTSIKVPSPIELIKFGIETINPLTAPNRMAVGVWNYFLSSKETFVKESLPGNLPIKVKTITTTPLPKEMTKSIPNTKYTKIKTKVFKLATSGTRVEPIKGKITNWIDQEKQKDDETKKYWETTMTDEKPIDLPKFEWPNIFGGLKDIGKYALIGGVVIIAIVLLGRKK